MKLFICICCIILGLIIAVWTTHLQSLFLNSLGVSSFGAIAVEPLLIIVSFLIGYKISKPHRILSIIFITIITVVSLLTILSMYIKNTYKEIYINKVNIELVEKNKETQDLIQNSLKSLTDRGISSKSTIKLIDRLQKQEQIITDKSEITELGITAAILSKLLNTQQETALLIFAVLISLVTAFAPSFLFFSSGLLINQLYNKNIIAIKNIKNDAPSTESEPIQVSAEEPIKESPQDSGHFIKFKKKLDSVFDSTPFRRNNNAS